MIDPAPFLLITLIAAIILVALLVGVRRWRREKPDAAELERRRRLRVNRIGRIVEGRIVEFEEEVDGSQAGHLLVYNYKVRGVEYQAAQDISSLRDRYDLRRLAAGHPAQVKYDPQNPTNSIIVCEEWSGL